MNAIRYLETTLAAATLVGASVSFAAEPAKADDALAKDRLAATYQADKAACRQAKGNGKSSCVNEAKATHSRAVSDMALRDKAVVEPQPASPPAKN